MLRPIRPVLRLVALTWYRWARAELQQRNPHHPDLAYIVLRINQLEAERA